MSFILLLGFFVGVLSSDTPSRLVTTSQGSVRGYKDPKYEVYVFYSIPYASAPTGFDRFRAPMEPPVWNEPFEAVNKEIICPQFGIDEVTISKNMQEDCLIANIYVPDTKDFKIPVVVYVHGGGFINGYADSVDPKPLVNTGRVIVVTFNYRLGGHGFLCLGTKDIPGNAGLKDQVAMLRWVQRNIASFGGNPDDVTIAGSSAGSASVDLLMLSKVTKGLFNKGIVESGSNTATFAVQVDPIRVAKEYATLLDKDINTDDVYALEEFFKTIPVERLNSINTINRTDATCLIGPCVERDVGAEMVLDNSPVNILKGGNYQKVPMLYGLNNMEGLIRISLAGDVISDMENMNKNISNYLPADLQFEDKKQRDLVANIIKQFYFGRVLDKDDILDYINYFTDIYFTLSLSKSIHFQLQAGNENIYLYEYSFTDDKTPFVPFTKIRGANHFDVSTAIWKTSELFMDKTVKDCEDYKKIRDITREMWLNFITTGHPTSINSKLPEWPPVGKKLTPYMSINKNLELRGLMCKERINFWDQIYAKYYQSPQEPSPLYRGSN